MFGFDGLQWSLVQGELTDRPDSLRFRVGVTTRPLLSLPVSVLRLTNLSIQTVSCQYLSHHPLLMPK